MKKILLITSILFLAIATSVNGDNNTATTTAVPLIASPMEMDTSASTRPSENSQSAGNNKGPTPQQLACKKLMAACEAAGYVNAKAPTNGPVNSSVPTGKNLAKDCMLPLLSGQTIADVDVNETDVQECTGTQPKP